LSARRSWATPLVPLYLHITIALPRSAGIQEPPVWLQRAYGNWGGTGVSCFFAISGFLITLTSIRRFGSLASVKPSAFYRIRFARIAPPLFLVLCLLSILHLMKAPWSYIPPSVSSLPQAVFAVITFQFNRLEAVHGWFPPAWAPLWSLSVEEMFYLCFPLLCACLLRRRWGMPVFLAVLAGFVVIGPFARSSCFTSNPMWAGHSYLSNMDNIALGCIFGLLAASLSASTDRRVVFSHPLWSSLLQIVGVLLMLLAKVPASVYLPHIGPFQMTLGKASADTGLFGLGTCLIMLGSVLRPSRGVSFTAPLRWIGRYSYEVYLSHEFVILGMCWLYFKIHKGAVSLWAIAIILLSGVLGFLFSRYFSEPMNRLLRGTRPKNSGSVAQRHLYPTHSK
jgi:peptidoglycan/LPS O-acetylase OafA/YrhL